MVKKQQHLGGLITSLFSGRSSSNKEAFPCPSTGTTSSSSVWVWQWPSCGQPRTLSFRQQEQEFHGHQTTKQQAFYKTMNSAYSVKQASVGMDDACSDSEAAAEDVVISALRSDRLFFEPDAASSSSSCIIEQADSSKKKPSNRNNEPMMTKAAVEDDDDDHQQHPNDKNKLASFRGASAMSVESQDPYRDFRESMEAVVMSQQSQQQGVKQDWRWLEEMLGWYLRANAKSMHGLIVSAFVDLLVSLSSSSSNTSSSSSSPGPAAYYYCSTDHDHDDNDDDDDVCSSSSL